MKTDVEKLQGTWRVVSLEIEGAEMGEAIFQGSKIILKGSAFETISMGAVYRGNFQVDSTATPKQLDLKFTEGPEKGNASLGIYELDEDTWKLCLTVTAKERPTAFATQIGSGTALETLRREVSGH
jgi:uncharacterized protein (TIGR03067 family)